MSTILSSLSPIWKVLVVGLIAGAGLPAMFALGLRFLVGTTPIGGSAAVQPSPADKIAAGFCFLIVALAVVAGLLILAGPKSLLAHFGLS